MCPAHNATADEQPMITVKDYRPSRHNSSSSSSDPPPDSTDDDKFVFDPVKPCPFVHVPRRTKYGRTYTTRSSQGVYRERPIVMTLQTPFPLRCWSINGPDESVDPDQLRPIVYEDENITVRMKDRELLQNQWHINNNRPGFKARIGKMSPLQSSYIRPIDALRVVQPNPRRSAPFTLSKSRIFRMDDVLETATQLLDEPPCLSDFSEDSEDKLDFTFKSSTESCDSSNINFCLNSSSETSSCSDHSQPHAAALGHPALVTSPQCDQSLPPLQPEQVQVASVQSLSSNSSLPSSKHQILALSRRVQQLTALNASLERELSTSHQENKQLQYQLRTLRDSSSASCTAATSPRAANANVDSQTETPTKRRSSKKKYMVREEERLRLELMEEKQRTHQVQNENERLLGVILKLKCEMELEHDLMMRMEKKATAHTFQRQRQLSRRFVRSFSSSRWDKRKGERRSFWLFGRSKSHKWKKSNL